MSTITFKRSAATVGVVAGLLAAAAPASAAGPAGVHPQYPNDALVKGISSSSYDLDGFVNKASTAGTQIGSEGVKAPTTPTSNGFIIDFAHTDVMARTNAGTQVGSEGVKANNLRGEAIDIIP